MQKPVYYLASALFFSLINDKIFTIRLIKIYNKEVTIMMKMKRNSLFLILTISLLLSITLSSCNRQDDNNIIETNDIAQEAQSEIQHDLSPSPEPTPSPQPTPTPEPVPTQVTIAMVGDILLHDPVQESGKMEDGTYNYNHLFANVKDVIQDKDLAIVNQEVILGGREIGLSGYPTFNGAYEIADALADTGFNVVLHATNHTLDKGKIGVENCINYWETTYPEIAVLGINKSQEDQDNNIYVYEKDDIKIAILNYTYGTNGILLPKDMPYIVNLLDRDKIEADVIKAKELADFIILAPHWGTEYQHSQSREQEDLAYFMADLGVDLVIGTHPHVVQPVKWIESENGNKMLVYYSIGNFVNSTVRRGNDVTQRMVGALAEITVEKNEGEEAFISDYSARPVISHKDTSAPGQFTVYFAEDYSEELAFQNEIVDQAPSFTFELCMDIWNKVYPKFSK